MLQVLRIFRFTLMRVELKLHPYFGFLPLII